MDLRELQADYLRKQREVTEERIKIGALIRTILSENDGLTFKISIEKLKQGEFFGFLNDEDCKGIFDILETSDIFSTKQKKRYGIHRR